MLQFTKAFGALSRNGASRATMGLRQLGTRAGATSDLINVEQLQSMLSSSTPPVILDTTWYMNARDAPEEYRCIPGARPWDVNATCAPNTDLPHMLPSGAQFAEFVSDHGISGEDDVVVYDAQGMFSAARCWWMFRAFGFPSVKILDGGLISWDKQGLSTQTEATHPPFPTATPRFVAEPSIDSLVWDKEQVSTLVCHTDTPAAVLADARSAGRFHGSEPEPRPECRGGHIPNSVSVPFASLLDAESKCFRPVDELKEIFDRAGVPWSGDEPVVTSCGSGVTACVISFALHLCGKPFDKVWLYDGSWAEWGTLGEEYTVVKSED